MKGDGRSGKQRIRRTGGGRGAFCSRWTSFTVAFSLLVQLLFIPYHQALAAPAFSAPDDPARIEAQLQAIFGDAATLCAHVDDKGSPGAPAGHSHYECPFCRFAAEAAALSPPSLPVLPSHLDGVRRIVGAWAETDAAPPARLDRHRARGPPASV